MTITPMIYYQLGNPFNTIRIFYELTSFKKS